MDRNKDILKIILAALTAVFLMLAAAVFLLSSYRKTEREQSQKEQVQDTTDRTPTKAPTPAVTISPTPVPTVTPTPTPVPTLPPSFSEEQYLGLWYSRDGLVSIDVYQLTQTSVSFFLSQSANAEGSQVSEADVTAEVAGNAAQFQFTDSFGSTAGGSMIFDSEGLYVNISTVAAAEGASVSPAVKGILIREKPVTATPSPTPSPEVSETPQPEQSESTEEYIFPDSDSRYLTDEELSKYSSSELELAKNEIYARHGRKFVTKRIADYFNSKSWYQGTIDPEEFDARQDDIFNEYESANIMKIVQWEEKKRQEE